MFEVTGQQENKIRDIVNNVKDNIEGRACYEEGNLIELGKAVLLGGDGHYLEIGTLFGGSALVAALVKKEFCLSGDIFCIDPLDGYYRKKFNSSHAKDDESGIEVSRERLERNFQRFGVLDKLHVFQQESDPLPEGVDKERYSVAFIDGDHWGDAPLADFINIMDLVTRYIVFDNCDSKHPDVVSACEYAAGSKRDWYQWRKVAHNGIVFVLEWQA